jgi:hypothetical protein
LIGEIFGAGTVSPLWASATYEPGGTATASVAIGVTAAAASNNKKKGGAARTL